jgi:hypothetical protein
MRTSAVLDLLERLMFGSVRRIVVEEAEAEAAKYPCFQVSFSPSRSHTHTYGTFTDLHRHDFPSSPLPLPPHNPFGHARVTD